MFMKPKKRKEDATARYMKTKLDGLSELREQAAATFANLETACGGISPDAEKALSIVSLILDKETEDLLHTEFKNHGTEEVSITRHPMELMEEIGRNHIGALVICPDDVKHDKALIRTLKTRGYNVFVWSKKGSVETKRWAAAFPSLYLGMGSLQLLVRDVLACI